MRTQSSKTEVERHLRQSLHPHSEVFAGEHCGHNFEEDIQQCTCTMYGGRCRGQKMQGSVCRRLPGQYIKQEEGLMAAQEREDVDNIRGLSITREKSKDHQRGGQHSAEQTGDGSGGGCSGKALHLPLQGTVGSWSQEEHPDVDRHRGRRASPRGDRSWRATAKCDEPQVQ